MQLEQSIHRGQFMIAARDGSYNSLASPPVRRDLVPALLGERK
jgi:hypothetical protein